MKENKANCHPELDSGSRRCFIKGFTLIELLIVVLIIGILSAIAVPQYQKAVLKSRFSSLMPTTQAIRDGNEMYYMTNGGYADALAKLDVTTANTEDMTITLSDDDDYAYTMATRPNINNNLIMYQKHSANFPGEIHCEALTGNTQAEWLCGTALHGTPNLGEVITEGYNTYVLEGTGNGLTLEQISKVTCPKGSAENACKVTENEDGSKTKMVCTTPGTATTCTYTTMNTDGSTTVCNGGRAKYVNGKCIPTENGVYEITTDEDGSRVEKECSSLSHYSYGGMCPQWKETEYDVNDKKTSFNFRDCYRWSTEGECIAYRSGRDETYGYDAAGNETKSSRYCGHIEEDGSCNYDSGIDYTYGYDEKGNKTSEKVRECSGIKDDGWTCSYSVGTDYTYGYDEKGNKTSEGSRTCFSFKEDGITCRTYSGTSEDYTWTYDSNGKQASEGYRKCSSYNEDGSCRYYDQGYDYSWTYDSNGNQTLSSSRYCPSYDEDLCSTYEYGSDYISTYDSDGIRTSEGYGYCDYYNENGSCGSYNGYIDDYTTWDTTYCYSEAECAELFGKYVQ